jgi:hypothetical protein
VTWSKPEALKALAGLWIRLPREVFHDLRYTLRLWVSRPWHAGFAIIALAIGIGANTGVFSVVNALLLRSLPFHEPDRLALPHQFIPPHDNAKDFHEWRQQSAYLADAAVFEEADVNLGGERVVSRAHWPKHPGIFSRYWARSLCWGVDSLLGMMWTGPGGDRLDATQWR